VKRVYYGWYIVLLSIIIYMLMVGTTFSAFALFVLPVSAELNLSRADTNTALILLNLGNALLAPFVGRMLDRVPIKRAMFGGAILLGGSLVVLGLSRSLWLSALVLATTLPAGYLSAGTLAISVLIARWFTAQRGRAMALAGLGLSLGGVAVTPVVGLLIAGEGWRSALVIVGIALAGLLLAATFFIRVRPGPDEIEGGHSAALPAPAQDGARATASPMRIVELLRIPQFWSIALSTSMALGVAQALSITLVPLALEGGLTMLQATSLISITGSAAIVGTLLLAVVADKVDRVSLLTVLFLIGGLVNAFLLVNDSYPLLVGCAALLGVTLGATTPAFFALLADRFGTASFGTVRGLSIPVLAALGMAAIRFAGEVFDRTGGYDVMFIAFIVVQAAAGALMFATRFTRPVAAAPAPAPAPAAP
jgi:MFS family permease